MSKFLTGGLSLQGLDNLPELPDGVERDAAEGLHPVVAVLVLEVRHGVREPVGEGGQGQEEERRACEHCELWEIIGGGSRTLGLSQNEE